eukprot:TRINITY_DN76244_c0_g1_i1.p2 TRINITY_DN76244_c0_g1~~TRINITY_DN76244_c0_g1_i1.p2  ORF type:complete len:233 (-),score=50.98 TRINITY_DN76244_c0_g1_i1:75-773(-)
MTSLDLDAIRARLQGSSLSKPSEEEKAAEREKDREEKWTRGPLGGPWAEETRLGPDGPTRDVGEWAKSNWTRVSEAPPETCGLLAGPGMEADGGPPDRLTAVEELEKATQGELDAPRASALHCVFGLIFWVQQEMVTFKPNLNLAAAGQKEKGSPEEELFGHMLKALNLAQQIARDVRNVAFSRFGKEKHGLRDTSSWARGLAEDARKQAASLKEHISNTMADSIGLSTGGG